MDAIKYLALDLHIATITYVLMGAAGRVLDQGCMDPDLVAFRSWRAPVNVAMSSACQSREDGTLSSTSVVLGRGILMRCPKCDFELLISVAGTFLCQR